MNTWKIAQWMSEGVKKFNAPAKGPKDSIKFGDKTQTKKPYFNCNTHHRTQGWRTRSGSGSDSHALTDSIIVDIRLRDTDDGFSYNANYAQNHKVGLKIEHDGEEVYSWTMSGIQDANTDDWASSSPYLITKPGEWTLYTKSLEHHSCGVIGGGWKKVGSFTAKEAHQDCFMQGRQDTDTLGECGECLEGYSEVNGECQVESSSNGGSNGGGASGSGSATATDNTQMYLIGGGILALALLIRKRRK
tara:strand:- start:1140 stop:1877 length:738 start_codon:yes stop_codon:yes gene_type:complete